MIVTGGVGTLTDTVLALRNSSDVVQTAAGSLSSTADYSYRWAPASNGDYFIEAKGLGTNNGTYRLTAEIEAGNTTASAGSIAVGETVNSTIDDVADIDYYRITLSNTNSYVFRMIVSGGVGTLSDATIASIRNTSDVVQSGLGTYSPSVDFVARWSPTTNGDYFIEAKGTGANSGTYRLVAEIETGGTIASAASIAVGESVNDTIDDNTDTDFYRITLNSNISYVFKMIVSGGVGTLTDTDIAVRDASNVIQAATGSLATTTDYSFRLVPGAGGDYYIEAKGTGANSGTYQLTAQTETGTLTTNYGSIAVGGLANDTIDDTTDTDYYRITLDNTRSYVFKMVVSGGVGTLSDTLLAVRNTSNATQTATGSLATTTDYSFRWEPGTSADYYIEAQGTGANSGTYRLTADIEAGGNIAKAGAIAIGSSLNVAIDDTTDIDYYKVTLDNTKSYSFRMVSSGGVGTLTDSIVAVRNTSDVTQTATATNATGSDYAFRWEPGASGDYYIDARGVGAISGTYRLIADLEAGGNIAKSLAVALGSSTDASIDDTADVDYYKVALENGKSYVFKMVASGGVGTLTDSVIAVRNSSDVSQTATATLTTNPDYSYRWVSNGTGDFYVDARGNGLTGTYRFTANLEAGGTNATALSVFVGTPLVGTIDDGGDTDWYAVELTEGYEYTISMQGLDSGNGTLSDTYINGIRNISGVVQTGTTQDGGMADGVVTAFTPTVTGTYFINCDNGVNSTSATGTYLLTVTQTNPPPPSGMAPQGMQAEESVSLMGVTTFSPESQAMTLL